MARPKKRLQRKKHACDGPVENITVSEGLNSGSVVVDAAKKDCLDSVSCGYVSFGCSVALLAKEKQRTDEEQQQLRETVAQGNRDCSEEQVEYLMKFEEALFFCADDETEDKKPEAGGDDEDHKHCDQGRGSVSPTELVSVGDDPSSDGPVGNITVLEGLNSGSVVVDAAKNDCLDSVSCGYVLHGRSVATTKLASVVGGPSAIYIT
jgi:hypothetical protein